LYSNNCRNQLGICRSQLSVLLVPLSVAKQNCIFDR